MAAAGRVQPGLRVRKGPGGEGADERRRVLGGGRGRDQGRPGPAGGPRTRRESRPASLGSPGAEAPAPPHVRNRARVRAAPRAPRAAVRAGTLFTEALSEEGARIEAAAGSGFGPGLPPAIDRQRPRACLGRQGRASQPRMPPFPRRRAHVDDVCLHGNQEVRKRGEAAWEAAVGPRRRARGWGGWAGCCGGSAEAAERMVAVFNREA